MACHEGQVDTILLKGNLATGRKNFSELTLLWGGWRGFLRGRTFGGKTEKAQDKTRQWPSYTLALIIPSLGKWRQWIRNAPALRCMYMAVSSQCVTVKSIDSSITWPSVQPGHRVPLVSSVSFPVPLFPHLWNDSVYSECCCELCWDTVHKVSMT